MIKLNLERFEPTNLDEINDMHDWEITYKKDERFTAISKSKDGRVVCTYILSTKRESITIESSDRSGTSISILSKRSKPLNNDGNGCVSLSGGYVSKRFGFFRKKDFQEFLSKHHIDSVRNFNDYGFCTTYVVESNNIKTNRIILPNSVPVSLITRNAAHRYREDARTIKSSDFTVAKIMCAPFWIYDEKTATGSTRKLFIHGSRVNALDFDNEISEMLKDVPPL